MTTQTPVTPATDEQIAEYEDTASRYASDDIEWTTADIRSLIARIRASEPVWQDIATAPRGEEYLVYQPEHKAGRGALPPRICLRSHAGYSRNATHWMPLPSPPKPLSYEGEQS